VFSSSSLKVLIVGQGLAGTALAWSLQERGVSFTIVDREEAVTSSKIAAGLLTPITGMRISLSKGYDEHWPMAVAFYRRLETGLRASFLHEVPHVRLFKNEVERTRWSGKCARDEFQAYVTHEPLGLDGEVFHQPLGGLGMMRSGWLDTLLYLAASRRFFMDSGWYVTGDVTPDAMTRKDQVILWEGREFTHVAWCIGWQAARHPWFDWLPFKSAKGTILRVAAEVGEETRVIHHGCWMVPLGAAMLRVGSTYDTQFTEAHATSEHDVAALRGRLDRAIQVPYEVREQQSAVRPIIGAQQTLVGRHPAWDNVLFLNGLASKGAVRAPFYARLMVNHLLDGSPLPTESDVRSNL
jgi:glycine oxidase